jgi:hypothetical protein
VNEWQPIETAPTNTCVLVYMQRTAGLGIYRAVRMEGKGIPVGWHPVGYVLLDDFPVGADISHWMPLPDPPLSPPEAT